MLPHGMGDIECDACAEKDSQIASLKAILEDPKKWMMWCDNKYIDRYEECEKEIASLKELVRERVEYYKDKDISMMPYTEAWLNRAKEATE